MKVYSAKYVRVVVATVLILLVPLVAMLFTDEVNWNMYDFVLIGALLLGAGFAYEFVSSKIDPKYRGVIAAAFVAIVLSIWVELAVGVFGSPFAGS